MYYAVIGLIRWTQNMPLLKSLEFSQKEKLRVVNIQEMMQIHSVKNYGLWGLFVHMHFPGGPTHERSFMGHLWSLLARDFRPVSVFRIIKVEFSFRVFVILDIQRGMHNTFFLAFTEHYISSLYSTQWSFSYNLYSGHPPNTNRWSPYRSSEWIVIHIRKNIPVNKRVFIAQNSNFLPFSRI